MENFEAAVAEILEVESVKPSDELDSFVAWDSLTVLSIIAFCDEQYGASLSAQEINDSNTIQGLMELVQNKIGA